MTRLHAGRRRPLSSRTFFQAPSKAADSLATLSPRSLFEGETVVKGDSKRSLLRLLESVTETVIDDKRGAGAQAQAQTRANKAGPLRTPEATPLRTLEGLPLRTPEALPLRTIEALRLHPHIHPAPLPHEPSPPAPPRAAQADIGATLNHDVPPSLAPLPHRARSQRLTSAKVGLRKAYGYEHRRKRRGAISLTRSQAVPLAACLARLRDPLSKFSSEVVPEQPRSQFEREHVQGDAVPGGSLIRFTEEVLRPGARAKMLRTANETRIRRDESKAKPFTALKLRPNLFLVTRCDGRPFTHNLPVRV